MKREFLEGLELNGVKLTKELVDQIMAENGKDIAAEQAKFTAKEAELTTANQTIKSLQDAAKKFEGTDPEKLKQDLADLQEKYDTDMADTKRNSALDMALMQANVHDVKAARALLNLDEVKLDGEKLLGLDSQLEGLKKDKAWLFAAAEPQKNPEPNNPQPSSGIRINSDGSHGGGNEPDYNNMSDDEYYAAVLKEKQ